MIRFSKILLYITIILLLFWLIPWGYGFIFSKPQKNPFILYSTVINDFAILENNGKGTERKDLKGKYYTESEFDSILPMFYYRQLIADERFPEEINGVALSPKIAQTENFIFRHQPSDVNCKKPGLYPLLESMSGRVDLKMPDDVFRKNNNGIEFIDIKTNSIDEKKSRIYTDAMKKKGFCFPANIIAGNPTARKDYDEGYLITDRTGSLYHLKQVKGRPYFRKIEIPNGLKIKYIFPTEFKNRKYHAFLTDDKNDLYVLYTKTYELKKSGIPHFNPQKDEISIFGNIFDWTVSLSNPEENKIYALDAESLRLLKQIDLARLYPDIQQNNFPVRLTFTSLSDKYVFPRISM